MDDRREVLLLGDQRLRRVSEQVTDFESGEFRAAARGLVCTLEHFRAEHGFGRALSAPQIGIALRMIALDLGNGPFLVVNPQLSDLSERRFTMWDDCMSFPWLMVRVERHLRLNLNYLDEQGKPHAWSAVEQAVSELLQHEVDHLDGILAIDRALGRDAIVARSVYETQRAFFDAQVDYAIKLTIRD